MKKGKIILGAAAALLSAGGVLAFKAHKFSNARNVYVITAGTAKHCHLCITLFTTASNIHATSCATAVGGTQWSGHGTNLTTFWTANNGTGGSCAGAIKKTTRNPQ